MAENTTTAPRPEIRISEHDLDRMPYDLKVHGHMTGLRMGRLNGRCDRDLAPGDHVTNMYGGAADFLGRVVELLPEGKVRVEWLSRHIGPSATTVTPREYLVWVSYRPSTYGTRNHHGAAMRWMIEAGHKLWHVGGVPGSSSTNMSPQYDGTVTAQMWGTKVEIRYNTDTGQVTWARRISSQNGRAYANVVDGPGAGHTAMMWLVGNPRR